MNDAEALEVARIVSMADSGCRACVSALVRELQGSFQNFAWAELIAKFYNGEHV